MPYKILIVEDEVLIADTIQRYLESKGHEVAGTAISFEEAIEQYHQNKPDLALLDIRLSGTKNGIDLAHFLNSQKIPVPYIFLTSQMDTYFIDRAKETYPLGYLSKPIQKYSLLSTIEISMHNLMASKTIEPTINLNIGFENRMIKIKDILFIKADHIYVKIYLSGGEEVMLRSSIKEILEKLPEKQFVQTHRSFAINTNQVGQWDNDEIQIQGNFIPLSRSRRKIVQEYLTSN